MILFEKFTRLKEELDAELLTYTEVGQRWQRWPLRKVDIGRNWGEEKETS
jgi:hypothetical protein